MKSRKSPAPSRDDTRRNFLKKLTVLSAASAGVSLPAVKALANDLDRELEELRLEGCEPLSQFPERFNRLIDVLQAIAKQR